MSKVDDGDRDAARIVRIEVPITVLRAIDRVVTTGSGGFSSRTEFFVDAALERLQDFRTGALRQSASGLGSSEVVALPPEAVPTALRGEDLQLSGIPLPEWVAPAPEEGLLDEGFMIGFHNRDYPSLWALHRLGSVLSREPGNWRIAVESVVAEAWALGRSIADVAGEDRAATALFPTNSQKTKQAESAFVSFAIGALGAPGSDRRLGGPLFRWQALGLEVHDGVNRVGVTDRGLALLRELEGLAPFAPHEERHARAFLTHLAVTASDDLDGFALVVGSLADGLSSREDLLDVFQGSLTGRSDAEIATTVAGYVSRAREWGLVEPRQVANRYVITPFGIEMREELQWAIL